MSTVQPQTAKATTVIPSTLTEWALDPSHSQVHFSVRHMMITSVRGEFQKLAGVVRLDPNDLTRSSVSVTIDVDSINTREAKRDAHLKSADFFDAEKFPKLTFNSTRIEKGPGVSFKVTGDLTMHGITKPVTLEVESLSMPVKNPWGQTLRGASARAKLNRKDFGLNWNQALEAGGVLVGEEVKLEIEAELVEQTPGATR